LPEQLLPEQLFPEQLLPEQLLPEQLLPEQLLPEQLLPEQLLPEAICKFPLNSPLRSSPAGFGGKASHCSLVNRFLNSGSCHALITSSGVSFALAEAFEAARPRPNAPSIFVSNFRRSI
jgi:hypothetical protein